MLKPGDLIEFDRRSYRHWSVFEGDGYVVQYNGEGLHKIHLAEVVRVQLKEVVNGSRCRINNRFDREKPPLTAKETLLRAKKRLGERKYHVLNNNCEHFAKWCRNDHQHSAQTKILDLLEDYTLMDLSQNIYLNKLGIGQISWADAIRAGYEVFHHMSDQQKEEL
uniref:LRAT domain-containing protein n=1 Tax=Acrobeloides nanus TaxID=290746 RepID=A0A914DU95_9BILA